MSTPFIAIVGFLLGGIGAALLGSPEIGALCLLAAFGIAIYVAE